MFRTESLTKTFTSLAAAMVATAMFVTMAVPVLPVA